MKIMSVVMTHGERSRTIARIAGQIKSFSVSSDLFIWNNGPDDLVVPEARVISGVNDWGVVQKLTLPLLYEEYDVFFYCDDDLTVHPLFLERAVRLLGRHESYLVCTGGSVVEGDDPLRRRWIPSSAYPLRPFFADFGDLGCLAMLRRNVRRLLPYGMTGFQPWGADLILSASYWESGGRIYVPEQPDDERRCMRLNPEHGSGLCAQPGFVKGRNAAVRRLMDRGWSPGARQVPDAPPRFWT